MISAMSGLLSKKTRTPFGSAERCGYTEPGTAAIAKSSSKNNAVRIEVSWRQNHLGQNINLENELEATVHPLHPSQKLSPEASHK